MNGESGQRFDPASLSAELVSIAIVTGLMYWLSANKSENASTWLIIAIVLSLALSLAGIYIDHFFKCDGPMKLVVSAMTVLYIPAFTATLFGVLKYEINFQSLLLAVVIFDLVSRIIRKFISVPRTG